MSDQEPISARYTPTTTHAGWGEGHPRLVVTSAGDRYVYEITNDLTRIGSSTDNDIVLPGTSSLHATITHDAADEYVLTMFGDGSTNAVPRKGPGEKRRPTETLRTGAHFTAGPWRLVFGRDEFADHGRPYGGRQGGEFAHQKRQSPRPGYSLSTDQLVLIGEVVETGPVPGFEFHVAKDEQAKTYTAIAGETEIGDLSYEVAGEDRLVLQALSVRPVYRQQGIATDLIRRVLDDVRTQGKTVTILCPIVRTFIDYNPRYADLVDQDEPGVLMRSDDY